MGSWNNDNYKTRQFSHKWTHTNTLAMKQILLAGLFAVAAFEMAEARRGGKIKGGRGEKMEAVMSKMCQNVEEGSKMEFKCNCYALKELGKDNWNEEQQAAAQVCKDKMKEM